MASKVHTDRTCVTHVAVSFFAPTFTAASNHCTCCECSILQQHLYKTPAFLIHPILARLHTYQESNQSISVMCGRAAQTQYAATAAAKTFGASLPKTPSDPHERDSFVSDGGGTSETFDPRDEPKDDPILHRDNFNMSPGMDVMVIYKDGNGIGGTLRMDHKKWGLITRSGTAKRPLYQNDKDILQLCFANLCFNARSDTLYSKPTFSRLALQGKTCIVALDGYFEWKTTPLVKGKQPYFVCRNEPVNGENDPNTTDKRQPLFMAGLWTRVSTGRVDRPTMDSCSILTTESNSEIAWLHDRMPLCIWDLDLARQWLECPSERLKEQLDKAAKQKVDGFAWHKVSTAMSKLQFRGKEAIQPVKETIQSVKNFFATTATTRDSSLPTKITHPIRMAPIGAVKTEQVPAQHASKEKKTPETAKPVKLGTDDTANNNKKRSMDTINDDSSSTAKKEVPTDTSKLSSTHTSPRKKAKTSKITPSPAGKNQPSITSFFRQVQ